MTLKRNREEITLDDLPRFSGWPKRLLSLEPWEVRHKTAAEVEREFEREKWGRLLSATRSLATPTLDAVEGASLDLDGTIACYDEGRFYLETRRAFLDRQADLYEGVLARYAADASCLVELGAGFGSMLFRLIGRERLVRLPVYAGEFTPSGRELISTLARSTGREVAVGHCDFRSGTIDGLSIPENALIFTSFSVHYIPELSPEFVSFLTRLRPRAVVHFEPCYEHYDTDSLHGLMCRRYVELNDYTRNLVSVLESSRGLTCRTKKNLLGSNPLLPLSVIEWAPPGQPMSPV